MSKEREILTAVKTALDGILYNSTAVPFYDIIRDVGANPNIFAANVMCLNQFTKSTDLYDVTLQLGIRLTYDATHTGKQAVDEIGDQLETALIPLLSITGFTTVLQHFDRSYYTDDPEPNTKEIIKTYIYKLLIQDNG